MPSTSIGLVPTSSGFFIQAVWGSGSFFFHKLTLNPYGISSSFNSSKFFLTISGDTQDKITPIILNFLQFEYYLCLN